MKSIDLRAWIYMGTAFLTNFGVIIAILDKGEWPSIPKVIACCLGGFIQALVALRAYIDTSVARRNEEEKKITEQNTGTQI
jgi:hypothetical protein